MANLWKELHLRALNFTGNDDTEFLKEFSKKIPRFTPGCACREHWKLVVSQNPPTFGADYFAWTVKVHNEISKKINKPTYTVEESRKFYTSL